jgi:hypothetical protein
MGFKEKLNEYVLSLEQDVVAGDQPAQQDASQPITQPVAMPAPDKGKAPEPQGIAPEGYVELVRLLAKALVMNVPPESIDDLFSTPVTKENAEEVREALEKLMGTANNYKNNPEKIDNVSFMKFYDSINENNFYNKLKHVISVMKKYSNDVDVKL